MSEKYFLGAMTRSGFSTEFGRILDDTDFRTYILKGGAGTGKSSLMKKIAAEFEESEDVVTYCCSSDPDSLDAVVLNGSKAAVVDGTSPHVFDPKYPAACQKIVNLGEFWDEEKLRSSTAEIVDVTDRNKSLLNRANKFANALSDVCGDVYATASGCVDGKKLDSFVTKFTKKVLSKKGSGSGKKDIRQLTALTQFGCMTLTETLENYLEVYKLHDDYFAAASLAVERIADEACRRGYDVILCPSVIFNNTLYEHLLIPEAGAALVSDTQITNLKLEYSKAVNLVKLYDTDKLAQLKPRLKDDKTAVKLLSEEVYASMKEAKAVHDNIEEYYISAMDFDAVDDVCRKICEEIRNNR